MTPEVLYTTLILSFSLAFLAISFVPWIFIEDRAKYWVSGLAVLSVAITFLAEQPHLTFAPIQLFAIPIASVISFTVFAFLVWQYLKAKYPY